MKIHKVNHDLRVLVVKHEDDNGTFVAESQWSWVRYSSKIKNPMEEFKVGAEIEIPDKFLNPIVER